MDPVERFLRDETAAGSWPGAAWWIEQRGETLSSGAAGSRCLVPQPRPAEPDTLYDLASLTKPLSTAPLLALLVQEGALSLDTEAAGFLPGLECARPGSTRTGPALADLAAHRSGLPAWRPLYAEGTGKDAVIRAALAVPAEAPCGSRVIYSDLGYILLGELLERAAGRSLADLFRERIAVPLGLGSLGFHPGPAQREQCASTEDGNQYERKLAASIGNGAALTVPVRASIPPGEVHDGNAWGLGGAAGHAGLFGTAREVAILAREFLGRGRGLFQEETLSLFRRNLTPGLEEGRTFGWKLAVAGAREAQGALPESAFGHTGFTGTSLWIDPDRDRIYVLLTNRIHPRVTPLDMNRLRWRFHEIAGKLQ